VVQKECNIGIKYGFTRRNQDLIKFGKVDYVFWMPL